MLVVKQGGDAVVNLDSVELVFIEACDDEPNNGCYVLAMGTSGKRLVLGWNKNETHAKSVLEEILKKHEENTNQRAYKMPKA